MNTKHDKAAKQARLKTLRADLEKTSVELKKNRDSLIKIEERINEFSKAARASKYVFLAVHVYVYDIIACTRCTYVVSRSQTAIFAQTPPSQKTFAKAGSEQRWRSGYARLVHMCQHYRCT